MSFADSSRDFCLVNKLCAVECFCPLGHYVVIYILLRIYIMSLIDDVF